MHELTTALCSGSITLRSRMARWLEALAEFDYIVVHRPGKQHTNADSLSCGQCCQCGMEVEDSESSEGKEFWGSLFYQLGATKKFRNFKMKTETLQLYFGGWSRVEESTKPIMANSVPVNCHSKIVLSKKCTERGTL